MVENPNASNPEEIKKAEKPVVPMAGTTEKSSEPAKTAEATPETQEQINWRKFREVRDKERKDLADERKKAVEKDKEVSALKAALEAVLDKPQSQNTMQSANDDSNSQEEDEIQKRVDAAMQKREAKYEQDRREREKKEEPIKLKQTFPDFEKVCSQENIDYLEFHHPETFSALKDTPDSFDKWTKVYNAMKRYIPNVDASKESAKAEKNLKKPQSISSGMAQTGDTSPILALTDERKRDTWARMQRRMKGLE